MVDQKFAVSLHIMTLLAFYEADKETRMTSESLAISIKTNPTVVRRHVALLVKEKLIISYKGKAGGLKLARESKNIRLDEIYSAVSKKPILASPDKSPNKKCTVSCAMREVFHQITDGLEDQVKGYLKQIRLAEIVHQISN
jgi:DNA-binding IscR family transcriptional regulator